jgi:predicted component of type VI protein secretion system
LETASGGWYLEYEGRRVDLPEGEHTLGRSRGCGVVLRDPSVSRGHALLSVRDGAVTLQDLQSSNGTYVNGRRLEAEVRLVAGDRLILGETELFLRRGVEFAVPVLAALQAAAEPGLFCPSCGVPLAGAAESCAACGSSLAGARRSEAIALGEVVPVGEVLGAPSGSWEETRFRRNLAERPSGAVTTPAALPNLPLPLPTPPPQSTPTGELRAPSAVSPVFEPPPVPAPLSFGQRLARAWRVLLGRS